MCALIELFGDGENEFGSPEIAVCASLGFFGQLSLD